MSVVRRRTDFKLPNFVWQTVDFPKARKGMTASLVLAIMLSESHADVFVS